jgi:hypothetical protein
MTRNVKEPLDNSQLKRVTQSDFDFFFVFLDFDLLVCFPVTIAALLTVYKRASPPKSPYL